MNKSWICLLCPTLRSGIDLIWKGTDANRDGDAFRCEEAELALPIQTCRRHRRVRQPVERNVFKDVVSRKALCLPVKDARDQRFAGCVVVEHPRRQADGRVFEPRQSLRTMTHLLGVSKTMLI